ncbi:sialyltransferase [Pycnococcus provasolii]
MAWTSSTRSHHTSCVRAGAKLIQRTFSPASLVASLAAILKYVTARHRRRAFAILALHTLTVLALVVAPAFHDLYAQVNAIGVRAVNKLDVIGDAEDDALAHVDVGPEGASEESSPPPPQATDNTHAPKCGSADTCKEALADQLRRDLAPEPATRELFATIGVLRRGMEAFRHERRPEVFGEATTTKPPLTYAQQAVRRWQWGAQGAAYLLFESAEEERARRRRHHRSAGKHQRGCKKKCAPTAYFEKEVRDAVRSVEAEEARIENFLEEQDQLYSKHTYNALSGILPRRSPSFAYRSCAIVGNSAILNRHRFGRAIDAHHAVFRVNQAPTRGYAANVGRRATFRVLNKAWTSHYTTYAGYKRLLPDLEDNVTLLSTRSTAREFIRLANATAAARPDVRLLYVTQQALVGARQSLTNYRLGVERLLWSLDRARAPEAKRMADKLRRRVQSYQKGGMSPSTGIIAIYLALGMCARVTTFGFSMEISRDYKSSTWRYHYFQHYDDAPDLRAHPSHSFTLEGDLLMDVGKQSLGVGVCTTTPHGTAPAEFLTQNDVNDTMAGVAPIVLSFDMADLPNAAGADENRTEEHRASLCPALSDPDPPDPFHHDYTSDELGRLDMRDLNQLCERIWSGKGANPDDPTNKRRFPTSRTTRERIASRIVAWIERRRPRWDPPGPPLSLEEATQQHMSELVRGVSEDSNSKTAQRMGAILQKMGRGDYKVKELENPKGAQTDLPNTGFGDQSVDDIVLKEALAVDDEPDDIEEEVFTKPISSVPTRRGKGKVSQRGAAVKSAEDTAPVSSTTLTPSMRSAELKAAMRNLPKLAGWTRVGAKASSGRGSSGRGPYNVNAFHQILKFGGGKQLPKAAPGSGGIGFGDLNLDMKSLGVGSAEADPLSAENFMKGGLEGVPEGSYDGDADGA